MRLIVRTHWVVLVDLLLPAAVLIFLLPVNPSISSIPAVLWVLLQLTLAPNDRRWAAWPMVFVLLLLSRSWWLNEMPHPVSAEDGVLLVAALLAAAGVSPARWAVLLRLQLVVLPCLVCLCYFALVVLPFCFAVFWCALCVAPGCCLFCFALFVFRLLLPPVVAFFVLPFVFCLFCSVQLVGSALKYALCLILVSLALIEKRF